MIYNTIKVSQKMNISEPTVETVDLHDKSSFSLPLSFS